MKFLGPNFKPYLSLKNLKYLFFILILLVLRKKHLPTLFKKSVLILVFLSIFITVNPLRVIIEILIFWLPPITSFENHLYHKS
jgi:hypothetical protein